STRLHQDDRRWVLAEKTAASRTRQSMSVPYLPGMLGNSHLENRLRHVDRDRRTIHVGSSFRVMWTQGDSGTSMPFKSREESIPSLQRIGGSRCSPSGR